jgi:cytochrome c oxidase subunit 2
MTAQDHDAATAIVERVESRWLLVSLALIVLIAGMAIYAGLHKATMPQARVETIDPTTLHVAGEFIESNLGSAMEADGSVTVRAIGQQYSFTPQCLLVPVDTPLTFRATSADVVHGFLIAGTNINTMLVPGYVSVQVVRFAKTGNHVMPCHEFCGLGHEGMWANVHVVAKAVFQTMAASARRLTCVE